MEGIIKSIISKLKVKELVGMMFVASLLITFLPEFIAEELNIIDFREKYQAYLTICIIVTGSYYLVELLKYSGIFIFTRFVNDKKTAITYMKKYMSPDEMVLLVQMFYDENMRRFKTTGKIDLTDGRKAALESKRVIYRSSQLGTMVYGFSYNLQPYALEFLNEQLEKGNIVINTEGVSWKFR